MKKQNKLAEFQSFRLQQARKAKKFTIPELADKISLTRQAVYAYEKGEVNPSAQVLRALAVTLDVPVTFFLLPPRNSEQKIQSAINFRTLKSKTMKARQQASSYLEWLVSLSDFVATYVSMPAVDLPDFNHLDPTALSGEDIEEIAEQCRKHFGLGNGPLENLTKLLELKGIAVGFVALEKGLDGLSAWFNGRPFIIVNSDAYCARSRFDLAHELFHLIAHKTVTEEEIEKKDFLNMLEKQAHRFAGAFLAPYRTYPREIYGFDLQSLVEQKQRWGLSVQAQINRLYDLDIISEHQKARLFSKVNSLGWRKKEPLDIETPSEQATLFNRIAKFLESNNVLLTNDFIREVGLPEWFTRATADLKEFAQSIVPNNVIQFKTSSTG